MRSDLSSSVLRPPAGHGGLRGALGVHPGLLVAFSALALVPRYSSAYWTFNVMVGLVLAISSLGLLVLLGWAREISLAQAGLTGSALYLCQYASRGPDGDGGWPFPLAAAWAIGFVVAVSFLTALVAMRLAGPYVIVLTLAVQFWLENSIMLDSRLVVLTTWPTPAPLGLRAPDDIGRWLLLPSPGLPGRRDCVAVPGATLPVRSFDDHGRIRPGSGVMRRCLPLALPGVGVRGCRAFAGLAGAVGGPLYVSPPGALQYISFNSIFYLAVPVLAGFDSIAGTVAVAVGLTLVPQLVLEWQLNVYLLGGIAMAAGCLLGPRGLGRLAPRGRLGVPNGS